MVVIAIRVVIPIVVSVITAITLIVGIVAVATMAIIAIATNPIHIAIAVALIALKQSTSALRMSERTAGINSAASAGGAPGIA